MSPLLFFKGMETILTFSSVYKDGQGKCASNFLLYFHINKHILEKSILSIVPIYKCQCVQQGTLIKGTFSTCHHLFLLLKLYFRIFSLQICLHQIFPFQPVILKFRCDLRVKFADIKKYFFPSFVNRSLPISRQTLPEMESVDRTTLWHRTAEPGYAFAQ